MIQANSVLGIFVDILRGLLVLRSNMLARDFSHLLILRNSRHRPHELGLVHIQYRLRKRFYTDLVGSLTRIPHQVGGMGNRIVVTLLPLLNISAIVNPLLDAFELSLVLLRLEHVKPIFLMLILEYSMLRSPSTS